MSNQISTSINTVTVIETDSIITVTDNNTGTTVNITGVEQPTIAVSSPGFKGPQGIPGVNGGLTSSISLVVTGSIWASGSGGHIEASGNITASGNISASGDLTANNVYVAGGTVGRHTDGAANLDVGLDFSTDNQIDFRTFNTTYFEMRGSQFRPSQDGMASLGTSTLAFSSLHLGDSSYINFNNNDIKIQHSTHRLDFSGSNSGYGFDNTVDVVGNITASGTITAAGLIATKATDGGDTIIQIINSNTDGGVDKGAGIEFLHGSSAGSLSGNQKAGKILSTKVHSYLGVTAAISSNLEFYTANSDTDTLQLKIDNLGLAAFTGDISASGYIVAQHITASGNINAVGNISASGRIIANEIGNTDGSQKLEYNYQIDGVPNNIGLSPAEGSDILLNHDANTDMKLRILDDSEVTKFSVEASTGNVTASGNISSSGDITALNFRVLEQMLQLVIL